MELLAAAQKYNMDTVLIHIRNDIARQHPPFLRAENSLYVYSLAQKHGLRQEVLQAARSTLRLPNMTIDNLDEKIELMPGAFLHELWEYHQRVRTNLTSDLNDFIASRAHAMLVGSSCHTVLPPSGAPYWLVQYILSIGRSPHLFDLSRFHMALTGHIQSLSKHGSQAGCIACALTPGENILEFWAGLSAIYGDSITKAESDLLLVEGGIDYESRPDSPGGRLPHPRYTHMPDADVILQSSDCISFRVHRSILATSSPFFGDLFSLPQPPDHELVEGLPFVHLSEDAEVLNSIVTMLYPVPPEIPDSDDDILTLLSACQKYDMTTVLSYIRAEVCRRGLLSPTGAGSFRLFAIAYKKRLVPETKAAAHLTLEYPMTFEYLGEALTSFEGRAIFDLARFRRCCIQGITSYFQALSNDRRARVWVGCPITWRSVSGASGEGNTRDLPIWLEQIFAAKTFQRLNAFTSPLTTPPSFRKEYLEALRHHVSAKDCTFCAKTHTLEGEEFCTEIGEILAQVLDVRYSFRIEAPESTPPPPFE